MDLNKFFTEFEELKVVPTRRPPESMRGLSQLYLKGLLLVSHVLIRPTQAYPMLDVWQKLPLTIAKADTGSILNKLLQVENINTEELPDEINATIAEKLLISSKPFPWAELAELTLVYRVNAAKTPVDYDTAYKALRILQDCSTTIADIPTMQKTIPSYNHQHDPYRRIFV